jgi:RNA methyltransferase, TrmH family
MFPVSKLRELSPRTRMRKVARILQGIEVEMTSGHPPDTPYLLSLLTVLDSSSPEEVREHARSLATEIARAADAEAIRRGVNAVRHSLLGALHAEPAEWDLVSPETGLLDRTGVRILPCAVYLEDIRSPFNVGSIFRTAEAFGAARVLLSPSTPLPSHPRAQRTGLGATRAVPWEVAEIASLQGEHDIFALELGGTPLGEFRFPSRGIVLIGSEELGLSPEALSLADRGRGRVSIPLAGAKRSLNVSVAFGVLMQAWYSWLARTSAVC